MFNFPHPGKTLINKLCWWMNYSLLLNASNLHNWHKKTHQCDQVKSCWIYKIVFKQYFQSWPSIICHSNQWWNVMPFYLNPNGSGDPGRFCPSPHVIFLTSNAHGPSFNKWLCRHFIMLKRPKYNLSPKTKIRWNCL